MGTTDDPRFTPIPSVRTKQTHLLEEILAVLRSINDKQGAVISGEILEMDAPPPAVVDQIPIFMMSTEDVIGQAKVTEDGTIQFEVKGQDLISIVTNLISLNQVVGFHLELSYQDKAVRR